jgi:hypothetical protein
VGGNASQPSAIGAGRVCVRDVELEVLPSTNLFPGLRPLNKPVIVTKDTTTAPVVVQDAAPGLAAKAGPAYVVLTGISFSHFLNDTMQSLIASVYPILKCA